MKNSIAISIKNFSKSYNGTEAVNNISFGIKQGEFFGFLGPNGAGKTSTINAITGIAAVNKGNIEVFGHDVVKSYREARKFIGLAPQEHNFDPFLTTYETLVYQGGFYGIPNKICKERAKELLKKFDIWEKKDVSFRALSGGMKRCLGIARALIHEPKILVLDEPTAGADIELRHYLWKFLKELNSKGTTIFLTTHYIEEAERLCDRICIINKGSIIKIDEKNKIMEKFGKSAIMVELEDKLSSIPERLGKYKIKFDGDKLTFIEQKGRLNSIIKDIESLNLKIKNIDVRNDSLEDVFVGLVWNKNG